jgi:hypothetical protein
MTNLAPFVGATSGSFFEVDPVFLGNASVRPYERKREDPLYRPLRIYTLDPNARRLGRGLN